MISVLCPTRNRPDNVRRLIESAEETASGEETIEFVFYCDDDALLPADVTCTRYQPWVSVVTVAGPRITLSEMWNECYRQSDPRSDIFMQCGDDIVFVTANWDREVREAIEMFPDHIVFAHGSDGHNHYNFGTHGFVHKRWIETVGYFTPPYFSSDYGDTWLNDVANLIGRRVYMEGVTTLHLHPHWGTAEMDATHTERLARADADGVHDLYAAKAPEREADAEKLMRVMEMG
jgi:hypothetical protein